MPSMFSQADKANSTALVDAVFAIASASQGATTPINWNGTLEWRQPLADEVVTLGVPFLVVEDAKFAGFSLKGGNLSPTDLLGIGVAMGGRSQEWYDIPVWAIINYDPRDSNSYKTVRDLLDTLKQIFRINRTLNDTCFASYVHNPRTAPVRFATGEIMRAAALDVRAGLDLGWRK